MLNVTSQCQTLRKPARDSDRVDHPIKVVLFFRMCMGAMLIHMRFVVCLVHVVCFKGLLF